MKLMAGARMDGVAEIAVVEPLAEVAPEADVEAPDPPVEAGAA